MEDKKISGDFFGWSWQNCFPVSTRLFETSKHFSKVSFFGFSANCLENYVKVLVLFLLPAKHFGRAVRTANICLQEHFWTERLGKNHKMTFLWISAGKVSDFERKIVDTTVKNAFHVYKGTFRDFFWGKL